MSLTIENLNKTFPLKNNKTFKALKNINLEIQPNSFTTLLGPSGCGKTSLLRIIAGFEKLSSGSITYLNQNIENTPTHLRHFPMVFQSYALFPHMSVKENIVYGLKLRKVPNLKREEKLNQVLGMVELEGSEEKFPHQLSGGQQQRVALARALVLDPKIMLFDEPLSNLDVKLRVQMRDEIRRIQKKLKITVIYVTHDQEEAMAISDQIIVMNQGEVIQIDHPINIYQKPINSFVANFIGKSNIIKVDHYNNSEIEIFNQKISFSNKFSGKIKIIHRPENNQIHANGIFTGVIEKLTYLGSKWEIMVDLNGQKIKLDRPVNLNQSISFTEGDSINFDILLDGVHPIQ